MEKYTLRDNLISLAISVVLMIPITIGMVNERSARKDNDTRPYTVEATTKELTTEEVTTEEITTQVETTTDSKTYLGTYKCTAYCPCVSCCGKTDGITANGTVATEGRTIGVDPKVIPYGSKVEIDGVTYIAEDTGGAIKGNKIDIFFNTHEDALNYGVKYLDVYLVKEAN